MEFDLQTFLRDMRAEQRADLEKVSSKVETGFATITTRAEKIASDLLAHEKTDTETQTNIDGRLQKIEGLQRAVTWLTRAGIVAIFSLLVDLIRNHLPKLLAGK